MIYKLQIKDQGLVLKHAITQSDHELKQGEQRQVVQEDIWRNFDKILADKDIEIVCLRKQFQNLINEVKQLKQEENQPQRSTKRHSLTQQNQ
jgi:uncharacterized coiled-coil protein SlyX